MIYVFRINHKIVMLETFYRALLNLKFSFNGDREEKMHELLETGSFTHNYDTFSIEEAK